MIRVFTAFSGYDSQCLALQRIGVEYELVGWSEIDKNAIKAHDALFPEWAGRNYGDISRIDWESVPDFDLITYSSPCQDFSTAGLMRGGREGSGTRSSLLWEARKAISIKRPKYCILENVKNLVSETFLPDFRRWEQTLAGLGYINYWKVLNALDYGVPQNRERVFLVSIRDDQFFRFPEAKGCERRVKDILELQVPERYNVSPRSIDRLRRNLANIGGGRKLTLDPNGYARTVCAEAAKITTFDNYIEL